MTFSDLLRVTPGSTPDLEAIDPDGTPGFDGDKEDVSGIVIPE